MIVQTLTQSKTTVDSSMRRKLINCRRYTKKRFYALIKTYTLDGYSKNAEERTADLCFAYIHKQKLDSEISYEAYLDFIVDDIKQTQKQINCILLDGSQNYHRRISRMERSQRAKEAENLLQRKVFFSNLNN